MEDYLELEDYENLNSQIKLVIQEENRGMRLDKVLSLMIPKFSRSILQKWIDSGSVLVDGKKIKSKSLVLGGEDVEINPKFEMQHKLFSPEKLDLEIIHEDDSIIVLNKSPGLVVHPGAGNWSGTLLNGLIYRWPSLELIPRAGIIHRLDKDTSGALIIAKNVAVQTNLVQQLQNRVIFRGYLALVFGEPNSTGTIDSPIGRHPRDRKKMAVRSTNFAKKAVTHYKKITTGELDGNLVSLIKCELETGRTHQIRVHLSSIGFPIVGDQVYGKNHFRYLFYRQALHAETLEFKHPKNLKKCLWIANLPEDFKLLLQKTNIYF
tara:strand:- start:194 stop:1156 length:963 start_codon:yes stop_codon:yes gene_type:complete